MINCMFVYTVFALLIQFVLMKNVHAGVIASNSTDEQLFLSNTDQQLFLYDKERSRFWSQIQLQAKQLVQLNKDIDKNKEQDTKNIDNTRQIIPIVKVDFYDDISPNFDNDVTTSKTLCHNDVFKSMEYIKSKKSLVEFLRRTGDYSPFNIFHSNTIQRKTMKALSESIAKMKDILCLTDSEFLNFTEYIIVDDKKFSNSRNLLAHHGKYFLEAQNLILKETSLFWSQIQLEAKKLAHLLLGDERHHPLFSTMVKSALEDLSKKVLIMRILLKQVRVKSMSFDIIEYIVSI